MKSRYHVDDVQNIDSSKYVCHDFYQRIIKIQQEYYGYREDNDEYQVVMGTHDSEEIYNYAQNKNFLYMSCVFFKKAQREAGLLFCKSCVKISH